MRLEYSFELSQVEVPRFSVEAVEGIGKLYTLTTLVLNVLATRPRVEIVFHGLNADDPRSKIEAFQQILSSSSSGGELSSEDGVGGHILGSSSYFQWLAVNR